MANRPQVNLPKFKPSSNDYNQTGLKIHYDAQANKMASLASFLENKNDLTVQQVVKKEENVSTPIDSIKSYISSFFGGDDEKKGAYLYTYSEISNLCEPPPSRYENLPNKDAYQEIFCTKTYIPEASSISGLNPNDMVTGKFRNEAELADFIPLDSIGTLATQIEPEQGTSASDAVSNNETYNYPINNSVVQFGNSLQKPNLEEFVVGDSLNSLTSIVERELSIWKGKKENDSSVFSTLKKYWDNVGWRQGSWSATGTPWSAAYISYVVCSVDSSFPKSANHNSYAESARRNIGGWTAWQIDKTRKYKAQIGDILIYPRPEGGDKASHGDVVYKIEKGIAFLSGGNLANSAIGGASYLQLSIDEDSFYSTFGKYTILLKKNGKIEQLFSTSDNQGIDSVAAKTSQEAEQGVFSTASTYLGEISETVSEIPLVGRFFK
jgi:hypothetical protein